MFLFQDWLSKMIKTKYHTIPDAVNALGPIASIQAGFLELQKNVYAAYGCGEMLISKIISGGQTGVDRGALEAALELGFDYGGLIPKGWRVADEGAIVIAKV